jgi:outer membrane protein TolC
MSRLVAVLVAALAVAAPLCAQPEPPQPVVERVTFEEAVRRALERNPTVGQAEQAILRSQALLDQARSVFRPSVDGSYATTMLDAARGFDGNITQPRTQSRFAAVGTYPVLAASRWASARLARDQVGIARLSAQEVRRQVGLLAADAYLGVVSAERQREIAIRNRESARALEEYAKARLDAGQGSRLNHVRSAQELSATEGLVQVAELAVRQSQEALGIAIFAPGPVDASGDPAIPDPSPAADDRVWMAQRPDVRLFTAQVEAADRVVRDTWKSWLPTASVGFSPQYVTPKGFFEPAGTWRAFVQLEVPIYDGSLGATRRLRMAELEAARLRLSAIETQARSEVRFAEEAVERNESIVATARESAENAREALRITEIAYKAGATTNVEVVQAQQTARNAELLEALAEDRLRQARLDLLVALGEFPVRTTPTP